MPTYRWTFTCEEMMDDANNTVNITTKTLVSDSETFTDAMILLPQLINGVGFRVEPETFSYKDATFEDWADEKEETQARVLERDRSPPGFVGDFDRWTGHNPSAADPGFPVTGSSYRGTCGMFCGGNSAYSFPPDQIEAAMKDEIDHLAGFPPTTSEE